jgi:threonine/homoserine/homoserine lactone efflux protein
MTGAVSQYMMFALAFGASAALPGPEIAVLVSRSLSAGLKSTFALAGGIVIGKLCMLSAALAGLSALLAVLGPAFVVLKFVGAAYLVWLGLRKWRAAGKALQLDATGAVSPAVDVGLGLAMTLSNPVAIMFYLALLPGVVDVEGVSLASYAVLCTIIVVVMALVTLGYGLLAEGARKTLRSPRAKVNTDRGAGALMVGVGLMIASR